MEATPGADRMAAGSGEPAATAPTPAQALDGSAASCENGGTNSSSNSSGSSGNDSDPVRGETSGAAVHDVRRLAARPHDDALFCPDAPLLAYGVPHADDAAGGSGAAMCSAADLAARGSGVFGGGGERAAEAGTDTAMPVEAKTAESACTTNEEVRGTDAAASVPGATQPGVGDTTNQMGRVHEQCTRPAEGRTVVPLPTNAQMPIALLAQPLMTTAGDQEHDVRGEATTDAAESARSSSDPAPMADATADGGHLSCTAEEPRTVCDGGVDTEGTTGRATPALLEGSPLAGAVSECAISVGAADVQTATVHDGAAFPAVAAATTTTTTTAADAAVTGAAAATAVAAAADAGAAVTTTGSASTLPLPSAVYVPGSQDNRMALQLEPRHLRLERGVGREGGDAKSPRSPRTGGTFMGFLEESFKRASNWVAAGLSPRHRNRAGSASHSEMEPVDPEAAGLVEAMLIHGRKVPHSYLQVDEGDIWRSHGRKAGQGSAGDVQDGQDADTDVGDGAANDRAGRASVAAAAAADGDDMVDDDQELEANTQGNALGDDHDDGDDGSDGDDGNDDDGGRGDGSDFATGADGGSPRRHAAGRERAGGASRESDAASPPVSAGYLSKYSRADQSETPDGLHMDELAAFRSATFAALAAESRALNDSRSSIASSDSLTPAMVVNPVAGDAVASAQRILGQGRRKSILHEPGYKAPRKAVHWNLPDEHRDMPERVCSDHDLSFSKRSPQKRLRRRILDRVVSSSELLTLYNDMCMRLKVKPNKLIVRQLQHCIDAKSTLRRHAKHRSRAGDARAGWVARVTCVRCVVLIRSRARAAAPLYRLDISGSTGLADSARWYCLWEMLMNAHYLTELNMENCGIDDHSMFSLVRGLLMKRSVETLRLGGNNLKVHGLEALIRLLASSPHLRVLDLRCADGGRARARVLASCPDATVASNVSLDKSRIIPLGRAIAVSCRLEELYLQHCGLKKCVLRRACTLLPAGC